MDRAHTILHADLDSFFASVEQRDDPGLRGRPIAVGGGVVLAASYQAKAFGVRSAMPAAEARRRCPALIVVAPRFEAYSAASAAVFDVFEDITPDVEAVSIDEAFLDITGLRRLTHRPGDVADRVRAQVAGRVGLPISVGVAASKAVAKVASRSAKPDGVVVVAPGQERGFLAPLPIRALWGIGPVTAARLQARGVRTVADLAAVDEACLVAMLGRAGGRQAFALAHHRDPRRVHPGRRRRSIGAQRALGRRPRSAGELEAELAELVDRVARRLRRSERTARTVTLRLRFDDYICAARAHTLQIPTADTGALLGAARALLAGARPQLAARGVTLIGVILAGLDDDTGQLELPFGAAHPGGLDAALDQVRDRFGADALRRATLLRQPSGPATPTLPDDSVRRRRLTFAREPGRAGLRGQSADRPT